MRRPLLVMLLGLGACPPGGGGGTDTAGETSTGCPDPGPGSEQPTEGGPLDPGENAGYRGVLGGTNLPAAYTIVRAGQVDLPDADGCCSDYVVAGPAQNHVRVLIGANPPHGVVFLSEFPDQIFEMGPDGVGIEDVVVDDYDEDGHDDVLALRSDGVVGIRRGLGASAPAPVLSDTLLEVSMNMGNFTAGRALALAELNCDGKRDLLAIVTNGDRLHAAAAGPGDTFVPPMNIEVPPGSPQHLAVAAIDSDGKLDIVTANGDASFSVLFNQCGLNFSAGTKYPIFIESAPSPGMHVAVGRMCLGATSKDWPAVAVGYGHTVFLFCGNSAGAFDAVNEEPSGTNPNKTAIWDYRMDWDPDVGWGGGSVFHMQYWEPTQNLHVHWSVTGKPEIVRFVPGLISELSEGVPVADLGGPNQGHASALLRSRTSDGPQWTQIVVLGNSENSTDIKFAR